jgi:hypothetical protein
MRVFCDNCLTEFEVPYWRLGSVVRCPACSQSVLLERAHIRAYTPSGYEVTFSDFIQLVTDPYYRATILPLLRDAFGFELIEPIQGGEIRFRGPDGIVQDALEVHARIQGDPARQQRLYNNAMTLWH